MQRHRPKAAIAQNKVDLSSLTEKERQATLAGLRNTQEYKTAMEPFGTGSDVQRAITAATAAVSGLAGGNINAALTGAAAPYIANEIGRNITDQNTLAGIMAHAVVNAALAKGQGAAGAAAGEAGGILIAKAVYGKDPASLTEQEKQTVSALATLASGLAGGLIGNSTETMVQGGVAGKTTVENNALGAPDAKTRQDAKWSLPYIQDADQKAKAEQLIADLDAKDKAFDEAIANACKNLSSSDCQGMRQELATMGQSYDEKMDGQYIGTMAGVYKDDSDKVDGLLWQYATADAVAQKAADIQTIATNWNVSLETASSLYLGMAAVHTVAAIGGAVYGMKTEPVAQTELA